MTEHKKSRNYAGASAEERIEERKTRLLDAAYEVVGASGFKKATVRSVCSEAGLTQRYYYEAFTDAEDMLVQLYHRELDKLEKVLWQGALETGTLPERVRSSLKAFLLKLKADPRTGRIVFYEVLGVSANIDSVYQQGTQRFVDVVVNLISPLLDEDVAKQIDIQIIARAAVGAVIQVAGHWQLSEFDRSVEDIVQNLAIVLDALGQKFLALNPS